MDVEFLKYQADNIEQMADEERACGIEFALQMALLYSSIAQSERLDKIISEMEKSNRIALSNLQLSQ